MTIPAHFAATGHLQPHGIMTDPATLQVFSAIADHGGRARFVGGIVRDALLKRPLGDVDMACDLAPEQTITALQKAGIRVIPTGLAHGTVTAVIDGKPFEITTLRIDTQTDGRHATVAFTDDWLADARRRDFTFNAIYCDPDGTVYDPLHGENDLREGRVRFIGTPGQRIAEDYLRILRFFRFHALFGRPPVDTVGAEACRKAAGGLAGISPERIRDEMFKLLAAQSPAMTINDMAGFGILPAILPDLSDGPRLRMMQWLDSTALADPAIRPDPLRRMAALYCPPAGIDDNRQAAHDFARRLRLSNPECDRFADMIAHATLIAPDMAAGDIGRDLYRLGADAFRDAVLMAWAGRASLPPRPDPGENAQWQALIGAARMWHNPVLPVQGRDLLAAGLAVPGPGLGLLLKQAEEYWIERRFAPTHDELMAYLATVVAPNPQEKS